MTDVTGTRLFDLLPAVYRQRDAEHGDALRALLSVIEREVALVESNIAQLYDDWFVETADEWVIPYIGDLLGVPGLAPVDGQVASQRAFVANTIGYRRRKGTASVLEQLARDVTGWPAHVVEYFQLIDWNQYANHVRPFNIRTPDLRDTNALELLRGPLGRAANTVDVRHIDRGRGRFNIPNIGLHLWRLQPYAVKLADAREVGAAGEERYTFDPLGRDRPLFNKPRTESEAAHISREENLPVQLRRRVLYDELEAWRQSLVDETAASALYFRADPPGPAFDVTVDDETDPIPPEYVLICNLADWRRPNKTRGYVRASDGSTKLRQIRVAVDPVLGRLTFPTGVSHARTRVRFAYGFSGDVGGGPYDRRLSLRAAQQAARPAWSDAEIDWQIGVSTEIAPVPDEIVSTLTAAVAAWHAQPPGTTGVIAIMDSASYTEHLTGATKTIRVPAGSRLLLTAAAWPAVDDPSAPGGARRDTGRYVPRDLRPHLRGNVAVQGVPDGPGLPGGLLVVDGLLIEGRMSVVAGDLAGLVVSNCTLVPGHGGLQVAAGPEAPLLNNHLEVQLRRSIVGRIRLADTTPRLAAADTIIDGSLDPGNDAITAGGAALDLQTSTVLGRVIGRTLNAGNSILRERVTITRRQTGCVRFSYVPLDSTTSRRYRCQPTDVTAAQRVVPQFTSTKFGDPGYLQLADRCPPAIAEGAEDEGEMGAFHFLHGGRRIRNLAATMDQYLRFGMEAGIFRVS